MITNPTRYIIAPVFLNLFPQMLEDGCNSLNERLSLAILSAQCQTSGLFSQAITRHFNALAEQRK
jgi:hypothetical protein